MKVHTMDENTVGTITLRCADHCTMLVIDKFEYLTEGNSERQLEYNISMQDSRYTHQFDGFFGRIKRAVKAFLGKPIYYNDIYIEDEKKIIELRDALTNLINKNG